ncbi:MAG: hemerythrin domain-containing protein [Elusimicrobia bacterium]|nr:hemerythrin domain-containing protein [Elusimicrobiota bacterium]
MVTDSPFVVLEDDHRAVLARLELLQEALAGLKYERRGLLAKNLAAIQDVSDFLERTVIPHMRLEEQVGFPYLERHIPKLGGPIHVLIMEHQDFRDKHAELRASLPRGRDNAGEPTPEVLKQLEEVGTYVVLLVRNHIRQEREILFAVAEAALKPSEKAQLLQALQEEKSSRRA